MPGNPSLRSVAVILVSLGALSAGGCGASQSASTPAPASASNSSPCPSGEAVCVSTDPAVTVVGPKDPSENLSVVLGHTRAYRDLSKISVECARVTGFPIRCTMTAMLSVKGHRTVPVRGTIDAFGIDTATHTYAFQLAYQEISGA